MNKHDINIGFRIREKREMLKHSRETFAEISQISPDFLFDIETGRKGFTVNVLKKICQASNTSSDFILFGTSNQAEQSMFLLNQMNEDQSMLAMEIMKVILANKCK